MESKRSYILKWIEQEKLEKEKATEILSAVGVLPDGSRWKIFIENLLLWLGGLALAFALLFFIAYNWDAMGRFAKFTLVETSIIFCLLLYWKFDADKVSAKVTLTVATILLGVLLAFYGQTYQTGADPWQLFFNWALLMLPWAFISRFSAMWFIWVVLLNMSIMLYFQARGGMLGFLFSRYEHINWVVFLFNSFAWLVWELAARKTRWLQQRWAIRLVAIASGSAVTSLALQSIFSNYPSEYMAVISYFGFAAVLYFVYRKHIPDLFMLAGLCFSAIVVITSFFARHIIDGFDSIGAFLFLTLLVIGLSATAAKWLKAVQREMSA